MKLIRFTKDEEMSNTNKEKKDKGDRDKRPQLRKLIINIMSWGQMAPGVLRNSRTTYTSEVMQIIGETWVPKKNEISLFFIDYVFEGF